MRDREQFFHAREPLPPRGYQLCRFRPRLVIFRLPVIFRLLHGKLCILKLFLLNACKMLLYFLGTENVPNFGDELR
jgi:hypothetical protein